MARTFNDKQIGSQASAMLTGALRNKTSSFANHVNRDSSKKSLREAKALARYKKYGLVNNGTQSTYLRAIAVVMGKHGYIRHYGVSINRQSGQRTRNEPRQKTYSFKAHMMKQDPKPFLDAAIQASGVVNFVSEKIAENRSEEVAENIAVSIRSFSR